MILISRRLPAFARPILPQSCLILPAPPHRPLRMRRPHPMLSGMDLDISELRSLALRHARGRRTDTAIPRVTIGVMPEPTAPTPGIYAPGICLVVQGAKQVMIGEHDLRYDAASYFLAAVEVPATGCIVDATATRPYIGLSLTLDPAAIAALVLDLPPADTAASGPGFAVSPLTTDMVDAWTRLMRLLDTPRDLAVLAPLYEREILYRLLQGPMGPRLRQVGRSGSQLSCIRRAIDRIRRDYDKPLRIDEIAAHAGMSPSSFHRHFKAATAMSPLQYQKSLRLQQARVLMMAGPRDAAAAAFAVGYESASQFSREYARAFGAPPARDIARLRRAGDLMDGF